MSQCVWVCVSECERGKIEMMQVANDGDGSRTLTPPLPSHPPTPPSQIFGGGGGVALTSGSWSSRSPGVSSTLRPASAGPPRWRMPFRSSSSWMPTCSSGGGGRRRRPVTTSPASPCWQRHRIWCQRTHRVLARKMAGHPLPPSRLGAPPTAASPLFVALTSPTTYTFLSLGKWMESRYAAAA